MSCSNCFNGCTEIISDQCVRYTGFNIPALGISNGDTLRCECETRCRDSKFNLYMQT